MCKIQKRALDCSATVDRQSEEEIAQLLRCDSTGAVLLVFGGLVNCRIMVETYLECTEVTDQK